MFSIGPSNTKITCTTGQTEIRSIEEYSSLLEDGWIMILKFGWPRWRDVLDAILVMICILKNINYQCEVCPCFTESYPLLKCYVMYVCLLISKTVTLSVYQR